MHLEKRNKEYKLSLGRIRNDMCKSYFLLVMYWRRPNNCQILHISCCFQEGEGVFSPRRKTPMWLIWLTYLPEGQKIWFIGQYVCLQHLHVEEADRSYVWTSIRYYDNILPLKIVLSPKNWRPCLHLALAHHHPLNASKIKAKLRIEKTEEAKLSG